MSAHAPSLIGRLLHESIERLRDGGIVEARLEAELLLAHVLGRPRTWLYAHDRERIEPSARQRFLGLLASRLDGAPLQHLTGESEFYGLPLFCGAAALVPRPESELLVEVALDFLRSPACPADPWVLDVGTGCGPLALAVASQHSRGRLLALDVSAPALSLCLRNARRHKLSARVALLCCDLVRALHPGKAAARFSLVLANLPYVPEALFERLAVEVRVHEPALALRGGADGMKVYRRFLREIEGFIAPEGLLLAEIDPALKGGVEKTLEHGNAFGSIRVLQDGGGRDRVVVATRNA